MNDNNFFLTLWILVIIPATPIFYYLIIKPNFLPKPKYIFNQNIIITKGFYRGYTGKILDYSITINFWKKNKIKYFIRLDSELKYTFDESKYVYIFEEGIGELK